MKLLLNVTEKEENEKDAEECMNVRKDDERYIPDRRRKPSRIFSSQTWSKGKNNSYHDNIIYVKSAQPNIKIWSSFTSDNSQI